MTLLLLLFLILLRTGNLHGRGRANRSHSLSETGVAVGPGKELLAVGDTKDRLSTHQTENRKGTVHDVDEAAHHHGPQKVVD